MIIKYPKMITTDEMRNIALVLNDTKLNNETISVRQVREICRRLGYDVEEGGSSVPWRVTIERLIREHWSFTYSDKFKHFVATLWVKGSDSIVHEAKTLDELIITIAS